LLKLIGSLPDHVSKFKALYSHLSLSVATDDIQSMIDFALKFQYKGFDAIHIALKMCELEGSNVQDGVRHCIVLGMERGNNIGKILNAVNDNAKLKIETLKGR